MCQDKKIVIIAISRFHLFRMAEMLHHINRFGKVVTAYPRVVAIEKWPFMKGKVVSMPIFALLRYLVILLKKYNLFNYIPWVQRFLHFSFSFCSARKIRKFNGVVIGLSSFMEEIILSKSSDKQIYIVDHGSLHLEAERKELLPEIKKYGFKPFGNWQHQWMIEKMQREFESADYIFCCSHLAKDTLVEYGVKKEKIVVNQLGVDLRSFYIDKELRLSKQNENFRFLHVSNMSPLKGLHYLIDAFCNIESDSAELWLVGPLPSESILKTKIFSNERIKYLGYMNEDELVNIYNKCDLFVHPSLADGWAMTVLQAMASGLPVIVSDMTGSKEIVKDDFNGWIVPSKDVERLTALMENAINDRVHLLELGDNAAFTVAKGFDWSDYGVRLNDFFTNLERNIL
ncbi:glycosyltransferase family 4 protein [Vibrio vulnificus]|uniref:glycosyltransferase family 4 protein n=1 Tax=Vibrio vulnificus TaxID=672 RepID=UPI00159302CE|nr:glycosyltransferase family 4 protein [Vibrio vulnificus]MCA3908107.1 glycosyltransferase family 4 protein [Vibrio vulnificus]NVC43574.1 glycosyltransferase family 4 protein [Vibrio vulnificus]